MSPKDLCLALVVIVAWGLNFVVIKVGLQGLPPMLLGALRFVLASIPAVFFVSRPQMPLRWLIAYGMTISVGQFAFLFHAMSVGMPAGLASLVLQSQAFFTLILAVAFLGERFRLSHLGGLVVAGCGLALIAMQNSDHSMTLAGFFFTLCAASMWALGNVITRKVGKVNLMGLVVWGSLVPPIPFLLLSLWLEGPETIETALRGIQLDSILALVYLAFVATMLGYGIWSRLLSRYPANQVAPFSLMVPVVGISASSVLLGERLSHLQMAGAALVMFGLLVNVYGARLWQRLRLA
ncbi:EamA family transporter [Stutzerimonas azotifigens]|uniref:EamA family transporter n=1 Tax=Stutzerimonas azotifigens TaxID=291995 RepID=UPI0003FC0191|nr:EamA family transporter [Stutzerimonas azotifigens]